MKKRRIVFIIHALNIGGAERVIVSLLNHLDRQQYELHLIAFHAQGAFAKEIAKDVTVHDLGVKSATKGLIPLLYRLYELQPTIIFSGIGYLNALLSLHIPWMRWFLPHSTRWIARETSIVSLIIQKERFTPIFEWLYGHTYHHFDTIITQSAYMCQDLQTHYALPEEKMVTINNPVDMVRIHRLAQAPLAYRFDPQKINLLAVGALRRVKRFDYLIEAMCHLDERYILTVVGGGSEDASLKRLVAEYGLENRVFFEGHQPNPYPYMRGADVLLLSSEYEGFPNVILEANSCGLPVIAFGCAGGTVEIIREGINGVIVPCQSLMALVEAIRAFRAESYSEEALRAYIAQHYAMTEILPQYEAVLQP